MMNQIDEALADYNVALQLNPLYGGGYVLFYAFHSYHPFRKTEQLY